MVHKIAFMHHRHKLQFYRWLKKEFNLKFVRDVSRERSTGDPSFVLKMKRINSGMCETCLFLGMHLSIF
jgi:hypothetical protein